ncbi:MAG: hypothetical protein M3281_09415 [Chloroflexota bacterium]|nr:hypothetical protein [Chloroflexota bacterium]
MSNEATNDMLNVPSVKGELGQNDDPMKTPMARAQCPHCGHEALYGLPVSNVAFTVGCVNCKQPFTIEPPAAAYAETNGQR